MIIIILAIITGSVIIIGIFLLILSPGKPKPFLDDAGKPLAGSISEKTFITLGGIRQGMFIKSKSEKNPVLLYLHGGIPDYYLTRNYPTGLEDYFTVVWWEQRGSGLSYHPDIAPAAITLEQMISDTKELTNYLRDRFGKEKIYLMGRSGGSFIGIMTIADAPELFHAYIGVGQMSNHFESERVAYEYILKQYKEAGDTKMVRKVEASPVRDNIPMGYLKLRDQAMHQLGIGTTREMKSIVRGIFLPSLVCREYTLKEKYNLWHSKSSFGVHPLWNTMITTNLMQQVNHLDVPVYFFHGRYDYTVSYPLARQYFDVLNAPVKRFYTFENSAHSPIFEEPQRVREIFETEILNQKLQPRVISR